MCKRGPEVLILLKDYNNFPTSLKLMGALAKNYVDKGKRKCEIDPMPRQARLDAPSVLHHIMVWGIERRKIFINEPLV
jgi:hypothetical protein